MLKLFLLVSIFLFKFSLAANILVYYCPYGKTHLLSFLPLMQQLGKDGHNVMVYHIDNEHAPNLGANISVIEANVPRVEEKFIEFTDMLWKQTGHGFLVPFVYYLQRKGFEEILTRSNETYFETLDLEVDVVIIDELFTMQGIAAADVMKQRRNIPYIIYSPTIQTFWYQSIIALSRNYVTADTLFGPLPAKATDFYEPSKFVDRVVAFFENFAEVFLMNWALLPSTTFPLEGVDMERYNREAYFSLGEHIDRLGNPITEASDLVLVGSNCKSASKVINASLPPEWDSFIGDPKSNGTIYISFGSAVLWNYCPEGIKNAFIEAINQLEEYRIIFSWNGDFPDNAKPHVRFTKWAPQMALLSHPKTKVFLTHGGLKSLKESLCAEVPVVLMPLLAEQSYNAKFGLKLGIGLILNKYELTAKKIVENIREVANAEKYRKQIQKLKAIYLDRPMDASEYGSFVINKMIKERKKFESELYDSAHDSFLRRKGRLLNNLQFYGLDLILIIVAFVHIVSK